MDGDAKEVDLEEDDNFSGSTVSDHDLSDPDDDVIIETEHSKSKILSQKSETVPIPDKPSAVDEERKYLIEEVRPNGSRIYHVTLPEFDGTPQFVFKSKNLKTLEVALLEKLRYMKERFSEKMCLPFTCQVCWQQLPSHQTYLQHIVMCPVSCEECGELFPTRDEEREHSKTHKEEASETNAS